MFGTSTVIYQHHSVSLQQPNRVQYNTVSPQHQHTGMLNLFTEECSRQKFSNEGDSVVLGGNPYWNKAPCSVSRESDISDSDRTLDCKNRGWSKWQRQAELLWEKILQCFLTAATDQLVGHQWDHPEISATFFQPELPMNVALYFSLEVRERMGTN